MLRTRRSAIFGALVAIDTPTAAHIHQGGTGQNGAVVVTLATPSGGNPGIGASCQTVTTALSQALRGHPERYYVNVHTSAFPNGALRGQLGGKHKGRGNPERGNDD